MQLFIFLTSFSDYIFFLAAGLWTSIVLVI